MSSLYQLWRFENVLAPGQPQDGYDRLYVPQVAYTTGDLDIHDVAVDADGRIVFVNTLVRLPGDGQRDGQLRAAVATAIPQQAGRRGPLPPERAGDGGRRAALRHGGEPVGRRRRLARPAARWRLASSTCASNETCSRRACRCRTRRGCTRQALAAQFRQRAVWAASTLKSGRFEPACVLPGLPARACRSSATSRWSGLSKPRHNSTFSGLPLDDNLQPSQGRGALRPAGDRPAQRRCRALAAPRRSGRGALRRGGAAGVARPMALGFKTDEIRRTLNVGEEHPLFPH